MLSAKEKEAIDHEVAKFENKQAASIDALLIVQSERRFIDNDVLKEIAEYLEMSPAELDSIATFYNLIYRKPVGKNVIRVCDSISCHLMGYKNLVKKIKEQLNIDFGETTSNKMFTLLPAQCLGTCDRAPALMINEELFRDLDEEKISLILKSYEEGKDERKYASHL